MVKKPRPTVTITAKLPEKMAEELFEIVNSKFEGNISATVREAVTLLIKSEQLSRADMSKP